MGFTREHDAPGFWLVIIVFGALAIGGIVAAAIG
jgi:hypothetical protein